MMLYLGGLLCALACLAAFAARLIAGSNKLLHEAGDGAV